MLRVVIVYDISNDRARLKVSEMCLDYGLDRHQESVFIGRLKPTHIRALAKSFDQYRKTGSITIIPISADDWERRIQIGNSGSDEDE